MAGVYGRKIRGYEFPAFNSIKDPDDIEDYEIDFSDWMQDQELIESHNIDVGNSGLVVGNNTTFEQKLNVRLSSGSEGIHELNFTIDSDSGRRLNRTLLLEVRSL